MFNFPKSIKAFDYQYKKNFLKTVIFQVKFLPNESIIHLEKKISDLLSPRLPNKKTIMKNEVQMKLDKTPILISNTSNAQGFEFKNNTGNQTLAVTSDSINFTIAGIEYSNFDSMSKIYYEIVDNMINIASINKFNRLAIRKINVFEIALQSGQKISVEILPIIIKEPAINSFLYFPNLHLAQSGITSMVFKEADYQLNLTYGLPVVTKKQENRIAVIDIDLFKYNEDISVATYNNEMKKINSEIFNVFEHLASDHIKKVMSE